MKKMTKDKWVAATSTVGSSLVQDGIPRGLSLIAICQRVTDAQWNDAADVSEGMLARTDEKPEQETE